MYKKITTLALLLCTGTQHAADMARVLEIKPSYFFFYASPMNHIYDKGGFEIQGSVSAPVYCNIDLYGSIGYRKLSGHSLNAEQKTTLSVIPVDIGLKPTFAISDCSYYFFAVGPRYFHFTQHNDSTYVDPTVKGDGVGLFANMGVNTLVSHRFLLGLFGEYSYEKKKVTPKKQNVYSGGSIQIGGLAFGVSFGAEF